jgi:exodeoxyribonuclease VII small subunit
LYVVGVAFKGSFLVLLLRSGVDFWKWVVRANMAGFEAHLTQLETVVEQLERGDLTLEESVRLFEEGMKLSQACKVELEQAEGRIQVLVDAKSGGTQLAELEVGEGDNV